ncbi:MAG: rhomboid family intramembrane serine protease [Planctomycetes bacterium]|nr:rhomboid family intramembrane serine protease [Planctomycetota bacterium]
MVRSTWFDDTPGFNEAEHTHFQRWSVVKIILIINVAVFVLDYLVTFAGFGPEFRSALALNCDYILGIKSPLLLIQLVTYQFLHGGLWHIFMNMLILWFFGRDLENFLGAKRFLVLYLVSGILGGLFQIIFGAAMGSLPSVVGASGAVFGLIVYYAAMWPNRTVMMFPILVPIKVKWLALIFVGISVLYGFFPHQGEMTSHMCHLGGAVFGFLFYRYEGRFEELKKTIKSIKIEKEHQNETDREKEIDRLLDKIHSEGINTLTDDERRFLNKASQGYRKR